MTIEQYLENPPVWLIVGFFVFVWWFALTMIARMSGWAELADTYGDKDRLEGPRLRFQSMSMGRGGFNQANFGGVITLTATPLALEIATFPPFNVTMKPLLIPMTDLSASPGKKMFVIPSVDLRAARASEIAIKISDRQIEWIEEQSGVRLLADATFPQVADAGGPR